MRKYLFAALMLLLCAVAGLAGDIDSQVEEILARSVNERVTLNYSCSISKLSPVRFKGKLIIQGDRYYAEGNGLRIYCNGSTRWTVDDDSQEVYIENAGGVAEVLTYRDQVTNIQLSDVKYSAPSSAAVFSFDTRTLDSSWIVTDLR